MYTNIITHIVGGLQLSDISLISSKGYLLILGDMPGFDQTGHYANINNSALTGTIEELLAYASKHLECLDYNNQYCWYITNSTGKILLQCNCKLIEDS